MICTLNQPVCRSKSGVLDFVCSNHPTPSAMSLVACTPPLPPLYAAWVIIFHQGQLLFADSEQRMRTARSKGMGGGRRGFLPLCRGRAAVVCSRNTHELQHTVLSLSLSVFVHHVIGEHYSVCPATLQELTPNYSDFPVMLCIYFGFSSN